MANDSHAWIYYDVDVCMCVYLLEKISRGIATETEETER